MNLASQMKEKAEKKRATIDEKNKFNTDKRKKKIKKAASAMAEKLLPEIIDEIKSKAKAGTSTLDYGVYDYGSEKDQIELSACRKVMKSLRKEHGFRVKEEKIEGYNGQGMNQSDFYNHYNWTISWQ